MIKKVCKIGTKDKESYAIFLPKDWVRYFNVDQSLRVLMSVNRKVTIKPYEVPFKKGFKK